MDGYIATGILLFMIASGFMIYEHGISHEKQSVEAATAQARIVQAAADAKKQAALNSYTDDLSKMDDETAAERDKYESLYEAEVKKHPMPADCNLSPAIVQDLNGAD